jgi:ABC-2 type transport system ATP-binding protein
MQHQAIVAKDLTVIREGVHALEAATFSISTGKVTGLIGPSGSGKTTLIRAVIGAQQITRGTLEVLGQPAGTSSLRSSIGYVSQAPAVYTDLTILENMRYFAAIVGATNQDIEDTIATVDLTNQKHQIVQSLSGGQLARVSLAVALLGKAQLLVLDEPTVGLDPLLRRHLWQLFNTLADEGHTLLISSHVMDEAEQCADLLLMREGKVLSNGSKQKLLRETNTRTVEEAFLALIEGGAT